jgi:hypothetical protein
MKTIADLGVQIHSWFRLQTADGGYFMIAAGIDTGEEIMSWPDQTPDKARANE